MGGKNNLGKLVNDIKKDEVVGVMKLANDFKIDARVPNAIIIRSGKFKSVGMGKYKK
jgi:hypothetical protein